MRALSSTGNAVRAVQEIHRYGNAARRQRFNKSNARPDRRLRQDEQTSVGAGRSPAA